MTDSSTSQALPGEAAADTARRLRSIAAVTSRGIPSTDWLPVIVPQAEARIPSKQAVAERLFAMFAVCVHCEARQSGESWKEAQKYTRRMDEISGGRLSTMLTPQETTFLATKPSFLADKKLDQAALNKFGWRYECCHVLMWALGLIDELGYPDHICDVSSMGQVIWRQASLADFVKAVELRPVDELLDTADLVLRFDWACVDARIHQQASPAGLNSEVVVEWHYAFNWLTGANGDAGWDDISPDT